MGTGNFTDDFKRDAVAQVTEPGNLVGDVSARLGVSSKRCPDRIRLQSSPPNSASNCAWLIPISPSFTAGQVKLCSSSRL